MTVFIWRYLIGRLFINRATLDVDASTFHAPLVDVCTPGSMQSMWTTTVDDDCEKCSSTF